ncbi:MAG: YjbQ family protein [Candidatus Portnoybacteria bacterium]|nr:YjbQ family protein [Candidatus Portnoybacteria bacterium]
MEKISISTKGNNDIIDITSQVKKVVKKANTKEGVCLVFSSGSTCGLTMIENESGLVRDFKNFLYKLVPVEGDYEHNKIDDNGHAHLLSSLFRPSLSLPVINGDLVLGQWQQIVFIDFDNRPRKREIIVLVK